ncbi:hypothetical protein ACQYWQ_09630 [Streptomyces sp. P6-2-1]|uniref:hypothetical protein n=1 Tax=unclassified Streptomyces TaxID=2593676 RepID=UPI003D3680EA
MNTSIRHRRTAVSTPFARRLAVVTLVVLGAAGVATPAALAVSARGGADIVSVSPADDSAQPTVSPDGNTWGP